MRIYQTDNGMWVLVAHGGMGAEESYIAQTNDTPIHFAIQVYCEWTSDINLAQSQLDDLAEEFGLTEVQLKPDDKRKREQRFIDRGGKPNLPRLISLKRRADESYDFRGHTPQSQWVDVDLGGLWSSQKTCEQCEAWVQIYTNPMPNSIEVSGPAVALTCADYLKLKETCYE